MSLLAGVILQSRCWVIARLGLGEMDAVCRSGVPVLMLQSR
jgi:hypothetical protein